MDNKGSLHFYIQYYFYFAPLSVLVLLTRSSILFTQNYVGGQIKPAVSEVHLFAKKKYITWFALNFLKSTIYELISKTKITNDACMHTMNELKRNNRREEDSLVFTCKSFILKDFQRSRNTISNPTVGTNNKQ